MKGKNNVWKNIKTIIKEKEFKPLRIAILSQLVFTIILTQLGILVYQYYTNPSRTATMFLTQTNWGGGASTTLFAIHPTNLTNWTNFYSTSSVDVDTSVAGQVSLTLNESTATQTSDADFNTWSKPSNVYIPTGGNKITLLKPNGASCAGTNVLASECSNGWCNGSSQCSAIPPCAGLTSVSYSGQTYNLVTIGTQCWFSQNLNVGTKLAAGSTLPSNNSLIEKWCYSNSDANCTTYGGLYTWAEANQLATTCNTNSCTPSSPSQGICPSGWHIPTDSELTTLVNYVGANPGTQLKSGGASGFNFLLAGTRSSAGSFYDLSLLGYLWSASEDTASQAWYRIVYSTDASVVRYNYIKTFGYSVRCIKN